MKKMRCPSCGGEMKRNGTNSSGRTRWRCKSCGASSTRRYDNTAAHLKLFLDWLLSKRSQYELTIPDRTFRAQTAKFWDLWPILPICDEVHHVVYMDGLWLGRKAVILIARTDEYIIGCHLASSENAKDWGCLMQRIAPPDVLVCDGGGGIAKALRAYWPNTRLQRCTFHVFEQIKRCTTTRPKLQAGVELYGIAKDLLHIKSLNEAAEWMASFAAWCSTWEEFLAEFTIVEGRRQYKHERLRKARGILEKLCRKGTLFTYLDEDLLQDGTIPATSNRIESSNARIREILRNHRGMNVDRRIKAAFWWCYMQSEAPLPLKRIPYELPNDEQVTEWRRQAAKAYQTDEEVSRWGAGIVWAEFHFQTPWRG